MCGGSGTFGVSVAGLPAVGSSVIAWINKVTGKGYILSVNPGGGQPKSYKLFSLLHTYRWNTPVGDLTFSTQLQTLISKYANSGVNSTPCGATQDTYPGDLVIGDKYGPSAFFGRAQITIKGSGLAYTEFSGLDNSITIVAQRTQFDSFSQLIQHSTDISRQLTASGAKQGLGVLQTNSSKPVENNPGQGNTPSVDYSAQSGDPIYRTQEFKGGLVSGQFSSVLSPLQDQQYQDMDIPVLATNHVSYDGQTETVSAKSIRMIKTPDIYAPQQISDQTAAQLSQKQIPKFKTPQYTSTDKALQMDALLQQSGTQYILRNQLTDQQILSLYSNNVQCLAQPLTARIADWTDSGQASQQQLAPCQYAQITDTYTGQQKRVYKCASFITQQQDGSILIKDGWGSQIRMTGGNIYISSALDTFIRPGRDCIGLIPRRMQLDANGAAVIASKKSVKVAAQGSLYLSSAVGGQDGYTVLQNRSKTSSAGMVIRSNGNLSLTSSRDMYIGINDKTTTNAGDKATRGSGSICIDGSVLMLNADSYMKATSGSIGLYGYSGGTGAGVVITPNATSVLSQAFYVNVGSTFVGALGGRSTVTVGNTDQTFTVSGGSGSGIMHVRGSIQCKDITADGTMSVNGSFGAASYMVLGTEQVDIIPKVTIDSLRAFKQSIARIFQYKIDTPSISYPEQTQQWYNDNYICSKQLSFTQSGVLSFGEYKMPKMCWQTNTQSGQIFQPVITMETGQSQPTSKSYPGKSAWQAGTISALDQNYSVKYELPLQGNYTVNTDKEDQ